MDKVRRGFAYRGTLETEASMREDLTREHERLLRQTRELQREHDQLAADSPGDIAAHEEHRRRLRAKIQELREHLSRLKEHLPRQSE